MRVEQFQAPPLLPAAVRSPLLIVGHRICV
jgi:hypothetical protein